MRWCKQKKILLDHPYFDCNANIVLSRAESERIYNSGFPTFKEMIDGAKASFDVPLSEWTAFDEVIKERASKNVFTNGFVYRHRRFAVAFVIFLMVISFFTMTPVGRALASDFFKLFIEVIDDRVEIVPEHPDYDTYKFLGEADPKDIEQAADDGAVAYVPANYSSLDEFEEVNGYIPFALNADWLEIKSIESIRDNDTGLRLTTQYITSEGLSVYVAQEWENKYGGTMWFKNDEIEKIKIRNDIELMYAIDTKDGTFNGIAIFDDSTLQIGAEKGIDADKILKALQ